MANWSATSIFFAVLLTGSVFSPACVECANVLFFVGMTTYSHRVSMWPLVSSLAQRGHKITFVSAHPPKSLANPNVTEVNPKALVTVAEGFHNSNLLEMRLSGDDGTGLWKEFMELTVSAYELLGKDQQFLQWFRSSDFDLVVADALFSDFALGLAHRWNAQVAIVCTTNPYTFMSDDYGIPVESSWLPDMQIHYIEEEDMSLLQRTYNTLRPIYWQYLRHFISFPRMEKILREDLGMVDMPGLSELHKNVSLVLINSHYSEEYGRALPPFVIPVAGMHCFQSKEKTPKDLETFMNNAGPKGFIYVSFGSGVKLSSLPVDVQQVFFTAMRNSDTKFLVKWDGDIPKDMPKNAYVASWFLQQNVLAHPNIKGFITHGGLLGIQEAMVSGVPLIAIPVFAEQDYNANRIHRRRRGIKLDLYGITAERLTDAITALLTDPSYKKNMEEASKVFLDRPANAVDTAVWWVEYILRRGRVNDMKPLGRYQTWYQRRLLDVWLCLALLVIVVPLSILYLVLRRCFRPNENKSSSSLKATASKKKN